MSKYNTKYFGYIEKTEQFMDRNIFIHNKVVMKPHNLEKK
jgi:hypothetical protein